MQAVGTRQIQQAQSLAGCGSETPFLALDGHARVVRDFLLAAGEAIEQRGLAAVRVADQGDAGCGVVRRAAGAVHGRSDRRDADAARLGQAQREQAVAHPHRQRLAAARAAAQQLHRLLP